LYARLRRAFIEDDARGLARDAGDVASKGVEKARRRGEAMGRAASASTGGWMERLRGAQSWVQSYMDAPVDANREKMKEDDAASGSGKSSQDGGGRVGVGSWLSNAASRGAQSLRERGRALAKEDKDRRAPLGDAVGSQGKPEVGKK